MNGILDLLIQRKVHDYNVVSIVREGIEIQEALSANGKELQAELDKIEAIEHEILITDLINFCNTGKFDLPERYL